MRISVPIGSSSPRGAGRRDSDIKKTVLLVIKIKPLKEINLGVAKARGNTPYNAERQQWLVALGLYGEAPPERCTVFRLQISERVGNPVILVFKKGPKGLTDACYGCDKGNLGAFTAVKRDAKLYAIGVPFVNRRYTKGVRFLSKMEYKMTRGWTSSRSLRV